MNYHIPGIAWLLFLVGITLYEIWAITTNNYTLSQWVWHIRDHYPWFKWVVLGGVSVLMYHFFFAGHHSP